MKITLFGVVLLGLLSLPVQQAGAQNEFNMLHAGDGFVYVTFDFDPAPSVSFGYARSFGIDDIDRAVTFSVELRQPIFLLDLHNFQVEVSSRIRLVGSSAEKLINRFSLIYHSEDNYLFSGQGFSFEEAVLAGSFMEHPYLFGEIGYTKFFLTRIRYKTKPDTPGTWYRGAGGKFTFGLVGGYTFGNGLDLSLRSGLVKTETFKNFNPAGPPILVNLGVGYRF